MLSPTELIEKLAPQAAWSLEARDEDLPVSLAWVAEVCGGCRLPPCLSCRSGEHDLIFTTRNGTPLGHCWYSDTLGKSLAEKSGLRPISLHTFRKTGASILESLGVSRAETQVALRHKRPSVTDTYVRVYMEERREHIEQTANLLFDTPSFPQSSLKAG